MNTIIAKIMYFFTGGQSGFAFQLSHSWHGVDLYFPLVLAGVVACVGAVAFLGIGMSRWYNAKRKTATIAFVAALALTTAAYAASSTLAALSAVSSVTGTDLFYDVQSGSDFKATAAQISTYVLSQATISAGCQTTVTNSGTPPLTIGTSEPVNLQTGSNYPIVAGDCGKLDVLSNASAQTPTLPASPLAANTYLDVLNIGAGAQTITPASGTINGAASVTLLQYQGGRLTADGTNYQLVGLANFFNKAAPAGVIVGTTDTQTLTNKTLTSSTDSLGGVTAAFGSDAKGDLYYNSGTSNVIARLAEVDGDCLQGSGGVPVWAACSGSGNALFGTPTGNTTNDLVTMSNATVGVKDSGIISTNLALLNTANAFGSYNQLTGTGAPTLAAGVTFTGELASLITSGFSPGWGAIYSNGTSGLVLQGSGSSDAITLENNTGTAGCLFISFGDFQCTGNNNGTNTSYFRNSATGSSALSILAVGNNTSASEFGITVNGSGNTGGNGGNSATINNAALMFLQGEGTNALSFGASGVLTMYNQTNITTALAYNVCAATGANGSGGGQLELDGTNGCLTSTMLVKHGIAAFTPSGEARLMALAQPIGAVARIDHDFIDVDPTAEIEALVPVQFTMDAHDPSPQFGLTAQDACQVDERLCVRFPDGSPRAYRPNAVISLLVATVQKQQREIAALKETVAGLEQPLNHGGFYHKASVH